MLSVIWKFHNLSSLPSQAERVHMFGHCIPKAGGSSSQVAEMSDFGEGSLILLTHTAEPGRLCAISESRSSRQSQLLRFKYHFF